MVTLSFHGGVKGVTGSCYVFECDAGMIVIDCGMHQGERICAKSNLEPFDFDIKNINAVLVTHAHYDHTGRLPVLVANGFTGPIFSTAPTKSLTRAILDDAIRIMQEQSEKCGDPVLYNSEQLNQMYSQMVGVNYHTVFEPIEGVSVMFHDAGHILGSAFITIDYKGKRYAFSGDIGNDNVPILPETENLHESDYVVVESTYGNRDHKPVSERNDNLRDAITEIINRQGTVLIPAFSIERTQELLYAFDQLFDAGELPKVNVYLDSPLAIKATEIYRHFSSYLKFDRSILQSADRDFFSFSNLRITQSIDDSKAINYDKSAKIIIAGSGMMTGGRILHHLKRYLPDQKSGLLIIGYQAEETLGRQILDGAQSVTIHNEKYPVKLQVYNIESFSAHGDRGKLMKWMTAENPKLKKIFLVHGDGDVKPQFAEYLKNNGVKADIVIPNFQERILLD
jgi:metallo-beta-lactamase family protein